MSTGKLQENLNKVMERMARAAGRKDRSLADISLVAVSKTVDVATVQEAYNAGHRAFGENRVQELLAKSAALPADVQWHLIGHLQRNKVRGAVCAGAWLHAVDSIALLERIDSIAGEENRQPRVLLQVNLSGESTKTGVPSSAVASLLEIALSCRHLECRGLMTMAPFGASAKELRKCFGGLRELRDRLSAMCGRPLPELSMGMSGDFEIAIEEGATIVRVGTAIFGSRNTHT